MVSGGNGISFNVWLDSHTKFIKIIVMYFHLHTFVEEVHKFLKLETRRKYLF